MNIIDKFTSSEKSFVVKECDLLTTLKMFRSLEIDELKLSGYQFSGEHDLWLIEIEVTKKQWVTILKYCVDNKYRLVIKDREDVMHLEHYGTPRRSGRYPYGSGIERI